MSTKHIKRIFYVLTTVLLCISCDGKRNSGIEIESSQDDDLRTWLKEQMKIVDRRDETVTFKIEHETTHEKYRAYQLHFTSNGEEIPAHLLIPESASPPYPVMICLQGHAPGMFISLGIYHNDYEKKLVDGGRDFAIQAINNGWAALIVEQKGFGKRGLPEESSLACNDLSLHQLLKGNTMLGGRVYDVCRAIDFISLIDSLDSEKVAIIGHSAGGTTAYYAASIDQRIRLAVVSCSFCTFDKSWLK